MIPSMDDLENAGAFKTHLVFLRCLFQSDLASHFGIYKVDTLRDIIENAESLVKTSPNDGNDLTANELAEALEYIADLKVSIGLKA